MQFPAYESTAHKHNENNQRVYTADFSVTKSEENTRSHPEHGRKDSPR